MTNNPFDNNPNQSGNNGGNPFNNSNPADETTQWDAGQNLSLIHI